MSHLQVAAAEAVCDLPGLLDRCPVDGFDADFTSWGFYRTQRWRNYLHRHSFFEVCLAYAGRGRFEHGGVTHAVAAGEVFLARPGVVHEIESDDAEPLGIAFWGFTLTARPDGPRAGDRGWWTGLYEGPVVSAALGVLPATLVGLADEAARPRSGHADLCRALGAALIIGTGRAFTPAEALRSEPERLSRAASTYAVMHRYLADNLAEPITVRDVAAVAHLSERHAERLFVDHAGAPMMATLRRLRLERAAQLLLDPDRSVPQVAADVGYLDLASFRAAFRARFDQTPQTYRRTNGTVHER